jgi:hypothetical protein
VGIEAPADLIADLEGALEKGQLQRAISPRR